MTVNTESARAIIRERVLKGKAFLDENFPGYEIDLSILDIGNEYRCALAQAANGDYFEVVDQLDLTWEDEASMGFMPTPIPGMVMIEVSVLGLLNEEWKEVLNSN